MSELFHQFATGSEEAFKLYYLKYHPSIYYSLLRLCGDDALAQDLTQDVFRYGWDRRADFKDEDHLRNTLFLKARTNFLMHLRQKKRAYEAGNEMRQRADAVEDSIELALVTAEVHAIVKQVMMKLPAQQKTVVEMVLLRGMDVKEVASQLRLAPQTVRNHKNQALRFLRSELAGRDLFLIAVFVFLALCFCPF